MPSARPRLTPAIADVRRAVRVGLPPEGLVLVAFSGGPDSLALLAAAVFEAPGRVGAVIVDHGLQSGSDAVAARAAEQAESLGSVLTRVVRVTVAGDGGPEAAARSARYAALDAVAAETGATAVLLGHTLDDQAETVLLGLARGSGSASLQGMAPGAGLYRRPLLGIRRSTTVQACADAGLEPWHDPHNDDPAYTRVRVRRTVLPVLEAELGPGVTEALARTAEQAREDEHAFATMLDELAEELAEHIDAGIAVRVSTLAANPPALRQRLIRFVVHAEFGVSLTRAHTLEIGRLVTDWHGQGPLDVPGVTVSRAGGMIEFRARNAEEEDADGHG